jgi:arylsulfatase A-like enzyme
MNVILVLIDSLNRHHLSAYVPTSIQTPHLRAFGQKAWRFENHFVGSLPCMPARREIFAGRKEMMWRPWGPLEPYDARLPRLLEASGYSTAIVTDHYHYWEDPAHGYIQSFQSASLIRGHEMDYWQPLVADDEPVPKWVDAVEVWRPRLGRRYYSNVKDFKTEEDFFPAKVMTGAARWLRENARNRPFFLQVESFDVHEPFHVPEPYLSMYTDGSMRDRFTLWPPYQDLDALAAFMAQTSSEELAFIRGQYAGKLTMVDRWFGELVKAVDELELWQDTVIIVSTDHGHDLGERGTFGKQYPHYDSHANIPLFIWHPLSPGNGRSISALTQTVDLFATVLQAVEIPVPEPTHSQGLLKLLNGSDNHRDTLLYGFFGQGVCVTDGEWTLFKSPQLDEPLYYYSCIQYQSLVADVAQQPPVDQGFFVPGISYPQWRIPTRYRAITRENFLFHRLEDPDQQHNLWDRDKPQRERMIELLRDILNAEGTPSEQYIRLGL